LTRAAAALLVGGSAILARASSMSTKIIQRSSGNRLQRTNPLWADDDGSLAWRHRRSQLSVGDDIASRVGFAVEPLLHGSPGDAPCPAGANQIAHGYGLAAAVGPLQRDEQVVVTLLDGGNGRSALE
jgi:hypothetical protein